MITKVIFPEWGCSNEFIFMTEPNCTCANLIIAQYYLLPQGLRLPISSRVVVAMEKIGEKHNIEKENNDPKKEVFVPFKTSGKFGRSSVNSKPKLPRQWLKLHPFQ